jgi:hypothetical protein
MPSARIGLAGGADLRELGDDGRRLRIAALGHGTRARTGPVWISHTRAPMRADASTCAASASMNTDVRMPAPASRATMSRKPRFLRDDCRVRLR